jgi:hypothetical protein
VQSFSLTNDGEDAFSSTATYDPTAPALSNGQFVTVPKRGSASVKVDIDRKAYNAQKPLGSMVVVFDNKSGASEALLVKVK